jgi:hypothetical protein
VIVTKRPGVNHAGAQPRVTLLRARRAARVNAGLGAAG